MADYPTVSTHKVRSSWMQCVLIVGILVGIADHAIGFGLFVAALGRPVLAILQHPASGLLGPEAYRGGLRTAALGTVLHFSIAIGWTASFALLYRTSSAVRRASQKTVGLLLIAVAAGTIVWIGMNNVVMPLSQTRPYPLTSALFWIILGGHIPFVGLPLVWGVRRWAPQPFTTRQG